MNSTALKTERDRVAARVAATSFEAEPERYVAARIVRDHLDGLLEHKVTPTKRALALKAVDHALRVFSNQ